jgi:2,4-dienoyl-CoA reductase-like NADH-dependent reductase (Old Yellow Enzyme family)
MSDTYPHVFEPLQLRHRTLASRITFGAHTANMAEDGLPGERHIGYYRERALGGAGMIVVEPMPVHRTAVLTRGNFRHDDDAVIPAFRRLTDACRDANPDVVLIHQLYHVGSTATRTTRSLRTGLRRGCRRTTTPTGATR